MSDRPGEEYRDDSSIGSHELVLVRIPQDNTHQTDSRPASNNFDYDKHGGGTSVTVWRSDNDVVAVMKDHDGYDLVSLSVAEIRKNGLGIMFDPLPNNPNHAELFGKRTRGTRQKLARACTWEDPDPKT